MNFEKKLRRSYGVCELQFHNITLSTVIAFELLNLKPTLVEECIRSVNNAEIKKEIRSTDLY